MNAAMLGRYLSNHDLAHMAVRFGTNRLSQRICMLDQAHDEFAPARAHWKLTAVVSRQKWSGREAIG